MGWIRRIITRKAMRSVQGEVLQRLAERFGITSADLPRVDYVGNTRYERHFAARPGELARLRREAARGCTHPAFVSPDGLAITMNLDAFPYIHEGTPWSQSLRGWDVPYHAIIGHEILHGIVRGTRAEWLAEWACSDEMQRVVGELAEWLGSLPGVNAPHSILGEEALAELWAFAATPPLLNGRQVATDRNGECAGYLQLVASVLDRMPPEFYHVS